MEISGRVFKGIRKIHPLLEIIINTKETTMIIPCENCLTIPICKNQHLNRVLAKCTLIKQHMRDQSQYYSKITSMGKPTTGFTLSVRINEIKKVFWLRVTEELIYISNKVAFTSKTEYAIRRYQKD